MSIQRKKDRLEARIAHLYEEIVSVQRELGPEHLTSALDLATEHVSMVFDGAKKEYLKELECIEVALDGDNEECFVLTAEHIVHNVSVVTDKGDIDTSVIMDLTICGTYEYDDD